MSSSNLHAFHTSVPIEIQDISRQLFALQVPVMSLQVKGDPYRLLETKKKFNLPGTETIVQYVTYLHGGEFSRTKLLEGTVLPFLHEVTRPNLVTYLNRTPIFKWCVVRCRTKDRQQKEMCSKEIRLCAQNVLTNLGSIMNTIGGTYSMSSFKKENLYFDNE